MHENLFQYAPSAHTRLPGGYFRSHFLTFLIGSEACTYLAFFLLRYCSGSCLVSAQCVSPLPQLPHHRPEREGNTEGVPVTAAPANFSSFLPLSQQEALPSQRHYPARGSLPQSRVQLVFPKQVLVIDQGKGSPRKAETSLSYFLALGKPSELGPAMVSRVS